MHDAMVAKRGLDPSVVAKLLCTHPAKRFALAPQKGGIFIGADADAEDLLKAGKNLNRIGEAYRSANDFIFYLELHIEQGARLCTHKIQIGVVAAVVGIFRYLAIVEGKAAHAGTTPMQLQRPRLG